MQKRSVMPNKARIRRLRQEKGWSQEELARIAGYNKRTIERVEQKGQRISLDAIHCICEALGVGIHDLIVPDIDGGDDPREWLDRTIRADIASNYGYAIDMAVAILDSVDTRTEIFGETCVRLASFYDHRGDWEAAIDVLQSNLLSDQTRLGGLVKGQLRWALYQRGIVRRRYAEDLLGRTGRKRTARINKLLAGARSDFEEVLRTGHGGQLAAPLHQLGVLFIIDRKYQLAIKKLKESLKQRLTCAANPTNPEVVYRLAYTRRRIGQCLAHLGKLKKARQEYAIAMEMAQECRHERLMVEIQRELDAWFEDETGMN